MAARTEEIIAFLDELLEIRGFPDMGPNGLQVPGASTVSTVVTGVSGQLELFERAAELGAQLVIVHHGILWDFEPRRVGLAQAKRLKTLLANDVALAAALPAWVTLTTLLPGLGADDAPAPADTLPAGYVAITAALAVGALLVALARAPGAGADAHPSTDAETPTTASTG